METKAKVESHVDNLDLYLHFYLHKVWMLWHHGDITFWNLFFHLFSWSHSLCVCVCLCLWVCVCVCVCVHVCWKSSSRTYIGVNGAVESYSCQLEAYNSKSVNPTDKVDTLWKRRQVWLQPENITVFEWNLWLGASGKENISESFFWMVCLGQSMPEMSIF